MDTLEQRQTFERTVATAANPLQIYGAARSLRRGDSKALTPIAAAFARAAFVDPFAVGPVYDAFTAGYLGEAMPEVTAMPGDGFVLPRAFWDYFWGHLDAQRTGAFAP
ncbi:MAG TPA: hypothetical protein VHL34_09285, partial [Rhizomicrobium sp.]|nr:hypothetical protein [Rhizomicrobium sp.]